MDQGTCRLTASGHDRSLGGRLVASRSRLRSCAAGTGASEVSTRPASMRSRSSTSFPVTIRRTSASATVADQRHGRLDLCGGVQTSVVLWGTLKILVGETE
jgi:hypothetical protein